MLKSPQARSRSRWTGPALLVAGLAVVAGILVGMDFARAADTRDLAPQAGKVYFGDLESSLPAATHWTVAEDRGHTYFLMWVAYSPRSWAWIPSGAPAYVFDADGKLVDWTIETGEGGWVGQLAERSTRLADPPWSSNPAWRVAGGG